MTGMISILIAAFCHIIFRFTIFFGDEKHKIMSLMGVSCLFILTSICIYLRNLKLIPESLKKSSSIIVIEALCSLFLIELFTMVVWLRIVVLIEFVAKQIYIYDKMGGDILLGFLFITLSTYFLIYTMQITETSKTISKAFVELIGQLQIKQQICEKSPNPRIETTRILNRAK